jgi:hypothetical protein
MKKQARRSGRWITPISKDNERRIYFFLTMGMIGFWVLNEFFLQ